MEKRGIECGDALVAQGIEQWFPEPKVRGLNPLKCTRKNFHFIKTKYFIKIYKCEKNSLNNIPIL